MKERIGNLRRGVIWGAGALGALTLAAEVAQAAGSEDALNMVRIGHADLQGRPAYEPTAIQQGNRFILYVGHHQGNFFNPLTQATEPDGTSIVDVTNPANPRQLFHIPGPPGGNQDNSMVRVLAVLYDRWAARIAQRNAGAFLHAAGVRVAGP